MNRNWFYCHFVKQFVFDCINFLQRARRRAKGKENIYLLYDIRVDSIWFFISSFHTLYFLLNFANFPIGIPWFFFYFIFLIQYVLLCTYLKYLLYLFCTVLLFISCINLFYKMYVHMYCLTFLQLSLTYNDWLHLFSPCICNRMSTECSPLGSVLAY